MQQHWHQWHNLTNYSRLIIKPKLHNVFKPKKLHSYSTLLSIQTSSNSAKITNRRRIKIQSKGIFGIKQDVHMWSLKISLTNSTRTNKIIPNQHLSKGIISHVFHLTDFSNSPHNHTFPFSLTRISPQKTLISHTLIHSHAWNHKILISRIPHWSSHKLCNFYSHFENIFEILTRISPHKTLTSLSFPLIPYRKKLIPLTIGHQKISYENVA